MTLSKSSSLSRTFALPELIAFDQVAALQLFTGLGILRDHSDPVVGIWIGLIRLNLIPARSWRALKRGRGRRRALGADALARSVAAPSRGPVACRVDLVILYCIGKGSDLVFKNVIELVSALNIRGLAGGGAFKSEMTSPSHMTSSGSYEVG